MENKKIFLTTTLPYAGNPHIGHMFEFIIADSLTRYFRSNSHSVYFNTGLDCHGTKIKEKSEDLGISPISYIESIIPIWLDFCNRFSIDYDNFYLTSDEKHYKSVQEIWDLFLKRGDLYKKKYAGLYCKGCESFKSEKELLEKKCIDHPSIELNIIEEENWHFNIGKYRSILIQWLDNSPGFLHPISKLQELKNLIMESEEMSISRLSNKVPWAIPVPNEPEQTIYCWFEALLNYCLAAGYLTSENIWSDETEIIQICGPDNLRFQGIIFQAMLEAEGLKHTDRLLVHGTVVDSEGKKMSKTEGNVIDPIEQVNKFGLDAVRYYTLAGLSTTSNSKWDEEELKLKFNNDICNNWGNLVSRTLHLIDTKIDGEIFTEPESDFYQLMEERLENINKLWKGFEIKEALAKTAEFVAFGNIYINNTKPWGITDIYELKKVLTNLYFLISSIHTLYKPVFPHRSKEIDQVLACKKKVILFNRIL